MKQDYSLATSLPPTCSPDYDFFLFHHPGHLRLQADPWITYYLLRGRKAMAQISYHVRGQEAVTPVSAPFGSYLLSENLAPLRLYEFIRQCEELLKGQGVRTIVLTEPPRYYRPSGDMLHTLLFNLDYRVRRAELSSGIRVDHFKFEDKIEDSEKSKLKLALKKGLQCRMVHLSELDNIYDFILRCQQERQHGLSMTLEALRETVETFPESFLLFGVYHGNELTAAAIAIRVCPFILYTFYTAHPKEHDSLSPVVMLTEGMYEFCGANNMQLLDLGTSALDGQPNFSLLDFKRRLGAIPSVKITFEKRLT